MTNPKNTPAKKATGKAKRCLPLNRINEAHERGARMEAVLHVALALIRSRAALDSFEARAEYDSEFKSQLDQTHEYWHSADPEGVSDALGDLLDYARSDLHRLMKAIDADADGDGGTA